MIEGRELTPHDVAGGEREDQGAPPYPRMALGMFGLNLCNRQE
jgi:hypothetical protein